MTDPMSTEELKACRERAEAATPGPWRVGSVETYHVFVPCSTCMGPERVLLRMNEGFDYGADAAFIASAREDVPRLLATVDHAEARAERAEAALAELRRRVVANAGRARKHRTRWAHVGDATGYGRTEARNLCTSAGVDPDERIGCQCQWEAGDSPCHVHGENEEP